MNYEKDIRIDDSALDIEFLEQATLFMKYSQNVAEMERLKDLAKEKLEFIKARLDRDIRQKPSYFDVDKITDKVVESTILIQEEYKEASTAYIQAKFEWSNAKGVADAFEQRKSCLEGLAKLLGQQYFAGPKVPRLLGEERQRKEEISKEVDHNIGKALEEKRIRRNKI
jgi:hypothetical protein